MSDTDKTQGSSFAAFNRCVRLRQVCEMTALLRSTIYRYIADGYFPKPFKLSEKAVAWRVNVVEQWIAERERT